MYDSEEHGLLISNTSGVYIVDKTTGSLVPIMYKNYKIQNEIDEFFEYKNEIYCYEEYGRLYRIKDGMADSVALSVVAHFVHGDKLYLLRSREPRIQVIEDGKSTIYSTGDEDGMHLYANMIELNGEVYGFLGLNWTGNYFIFKITDNGPKFLMNWAHDDYDNFKDLFPSRIYNIKDELWVKTSYGIYKYENEEFVPAGKEYAFNIQYVYSLYYENEIIFGINSNGIFKYEYNSQQTTYLYEKTINYKNNPRMLKGESKLYFQIDQNIYQYDRSSGEFSEFEKEDQGKIITFIESIDNELIIAKNDRLEWYNNFPPTIIQKEGVFSNVIHDIAYDSHNDLYVALAMDGDDYFLQTYDGHSWDVIPVPWQHTAFGNTITTGTNVQPDMQGNYYVAIEEFFSVWNGYDWQRISFLKDPDNIQYPPKEEYHILCLDSLGGLWISAYLREYSEDINNYESTNRIYRITKDGTELIDDDEDKGLELNYVGLFDDGIYLKNTDVVLDTWSDFIYYYKDGSGELLVTEDGDDHSKVNSSRRLCQNKNGELVICYSPVTGWSINHGMYNLPGGVSVFDGENWDHEYYDEILEDAELDLTLLNLFTDDQGNDCFLNFEKLIIMLNNEEYLSYPITGLYIDFLSEMLHINNEIWFSHRKQGLFKIELPDYNDVSESDQTNDLLKHEIITNDLLEIKPEIKSYQIYSLPGQKLLSGHGKNRIDLTGLSNGVYFIVCETYSETISQKFIISR